MESLQPHVAPRPSFHGLPIRPRTLIVLVILGLIPLVAAYFQWAVLGLPAVPSSALTPRSPGLGAAGFPAFVRVAHWINLLFMVLLARSGLQILMDHPRLYWNVHCTPGSEWLRFTHLDVPTNRLWTAKDDAGYLSAWIGLPGGRHTIGLCRHWHFLSVLFWVLNGVIFTILLFTSGQWQRLVPTSWRLLPDAWIYFVHYATLHLPPEPDTFYHFNALQQLSYFGVIFILAPLSILTGLAMSPALVNRFKWYPRLFINRQAARSLHFILLCLYIGFVVVHVLMVVVTGLPRNMNHMVTGADSIAPAGLYIGIAILAAIVVINGLANWWAWKYPRVLQHLVEHLVDPILRMTIDRSAPQAEYSRSDISPYFWPNGKIPVSEEWKALEADGFKHYRLKIYGEIDNPVELSLDELKALGTKQQITLHNCIQGWSGIAEWGGLPMEELLRLARPRPNARRVVFYSFGEGGEGGQYYDSHTIENVSHSQALLAYEMNFAPLPIVHGAPLRLRVENQLGFKMVKWIKAIEFVEDAKAIRAGEGGYNEDHEFYDCMADI